MRRFCLAASCSLLLVLAIARASTFAADAYVTRHEAVLGTSFELIVWTDSPLVAARAEREALAEIDRLARIVSTYDADSELSRWQAAGKRQRLSPELTDLLRSCDQWRTRTHGAFHPGVERLSRVWRTAERINGLPTEATLAAEVGRLRDAPWEWNGDDVSPRAETPVTVNAIAKGTILDAVLQRLRKIEGVVGATVNIGGDLRTAGPYPQLVSIPAPATSANLDEWLGQIVIADRAVATSSAAFRGFSIQERWYSHLLDPRTGRPVEHVRSATVVAPTAQDADVLATACSVLSIDDSLALLATVPGAECLLVDANGKQFASRGWASLLFTAQTPANDMKAAKQESAWNGGYELQVDLEINQPANSARYRRPYVAVWVEDADGFPVKTLVLWVQATGPGPRWIPDLKRWYRSDRVRKLADGTDLVETISEATRKPGKYSVIWKGDDNEGKPVKPGEYSVYVEAAREHGTYQVIRKKVSLGDKPFTEKLEGNTEIKAASLEYRKSAAPAKP